MTMFLNFKLQSVSFASLSPFLLENMELQLWNVWNCALVELSSLRGVVSRHGSSAG